MPVSQFTIYSSADLQGPGYLNGLTGSLVRILDACLVDGYGTGSYFKSGSGWIKQFANSGSADGRPVFGAWTQKSGSGFTLFVNDYGISAAGGNEASVTGWEQLNQIGPVGSASVHAGVGINQFPTPSQLLTTGRVVWRKSALQGAVSRSWIMAADASTMYMWVKPGDAPGTQYNHFGFGDFYSLAGTNDRWRCFVYGKGTDNSSNIENNSDYCETISMGPWQGTANQLATVQTGHYIARSAGGGGNSIPFSKKGDSTVGVLGVSGINGCSIGGSLPCPALDNFLYMSPLYVVENSPITIRGKLRGLYQIGHPYTSFYDGQIISGSADYTNKVFMVVGFSGINSFWAVEISPTLDTN